MITVVSGLPRSGTSLMMQMLEKGGMEILTDEIRKADESNIRGYYEYEKAKSLQKDNSWLSEAKGKAVKIIAQLLPFIHPNYDYAVIFMIRPIEEILRSQTTMVKNLGQKESGLSPDVLAKTFAGQTERVQKWLAAHQRIHTLFVYFPEVLNRPKDVAMQIREFLGIELNIQGMASAVDVSLWHQKSTTS